MKYSHWLPFFKRAMAFGNQSNSASMLEPRYLYCLTIATYRPLTSGQRVEGSFLKSTTISVVSETLRKKWLSLHQPTSFSMAQRYEFSLAVMSPLSDVSSKNLTWSVVLAVHWQSQVYSMNNVGGSTHPWRAPVLVRTSDDTSNVDDGLITTRCGMSVRKLHSQRMVTRLMSMSISFRMSRWGCIKCWWEGARNLASPGASEQRGTNQNCVLCVSVWVYANCKGSSKGRVVTSLEGIDVRATGRWPLRTDREGFSGTGTTFEDFQMEGMWHLEHLVKTGARRSWQYLRTAPATSSGVACLKRWLVPFIRQNRLSVLLPAQRSSRFRQKECGSSWDYRPASSATRAFLFGL